MCTSFEEKREIVLDERSRKTGPDAEPALIVGWRTATR